MKAWKGLDITRRYQIFFVLTAVLPILMFSIHLLENVYIKASNAVVVMLESGLQYVEDTVKANHHELAMSARQASLLSLNESYHHYLRTGNGEQFKTYLERYRATNAFDVVIILSPQRRILFNVSHTVPFNNRSFNKLINESIAGYTITGFERFLFSETGRLHMAYVAAAPIPHSYNEKKVDGVLLVGRYVKNDSVYSSLQRIMPQHLFRVIVKDPNGYHIEVSETDDPANTMMTPTLAAWLKTLEKKPLRNSFSAGKAFQERIRNHAYMTRLLSLNNQHANTAGYIAISVPMAELKDLMKENLGFIAIFIALLLIWIFLAGRWFRRDVIDPMGALTEGLKDIAHGDFSGKLPIQSTYHQEARETINSFNYLVHRLEENEQLRATFISTLSHDLKTPLLAQKKVSALLEENLDHSTDPKLLTLLSGLRQNNDELLTMVCTLLENYEYEEGQITLSLAPVDLNILLEQCFQIIQPLADENKVLMENKIPNDFPFIKADQVQFKRVLQNLVTNAVQNIPEGGKVWVNAEISDGITHIRIEDNGPGLSEKVRKNLFMRYNSGPRLTKRIGSGLGLFICRMIVELHQGSIEAESTTGKGTCFHIKLPKSISS